MRKKRFVHWTPSNHSYHRVAFTCLLHLSKAQRLRGRLSLPLVFAPTSNLIRNPPGSWVILILKKMNFKFHKNCESTGKILKSSSVRCNFVKFDIHFLGVPMRNFLWCFHRWLITYLALENVKKNAIFFKLFWYKVFVHWKLKLLNFLVDSVLISSAVNLDPRVLSLWRRQESSFHGCSLNY